MKAFQFNVKKIPLKIMLSAKTVATRTAEPSAISARYSSKLLMARTNLQTILIIIRKRFCFFYESEDCTGAFFY
uniref:CSON014645 protein n=1 Tax=Culicoides sonorensis TaxID=179676 RepID=A0A336MCA2_CULSO